MVSHATKQAHTRIVTDSNQGARSGIVIGLT
jgi:hypothetical protein